MKPAQKANYTMGGGICLGYLCNIANPKKAEDKTSK